MGYNCAYPHELMFSLIEIQKFTSRAIYRCGYVQWLVYPHRFLYAVCLDGLEEKAAQEQ